MRVARFGRPDLGRHPKRMARLIQGSPDARRPLGTDSGQLSQAIRSKSARFGT